MIRVGFTQRCVAFPDVGETRNALDARWWAFAATCGLLAVPLPNDPALATTTVVELGIGGVVLTGGDDLVEHGGRFPQRDATERALLGWALDHDVPVLGVCRGMQAIVRYWDTALVEVDGHVAVRHDVSGPDRDGPVNSYHRLAPGPLPDDLRVTARHGGVTEAVRHVAHPVLGIMWHPEREDPFDPRDVALVSGLFGSVPCAR